MNNNNPDNNSSSRLDLFRERLRGWRLGFSIDGENILKGVVCAFLLVLFALLQTTLFTEFRPLGAVPDLMLPLTLAVAMREKEKWGAVFGLCAAFVIESLGDSSFAILPILYTLTGYIAGILATHYFRDSLATRALFTAAAALPRTVFTLIALFATVGGVDFIGALRDVALPEYAATVLFSPLPHLAAYLALKPFSSASHLKDESGDGKKNK